MPNVTSNSIWYQIAHYHPSPFVLWVAIVQCGLVLTTIVGNLLVCIVISLDKNLQSVTNYMLMSLALADLAVAIFVMPPGIIVFYLDGKWVFGKRLCAVWCLLDVLMCTSSIMHLTSISIDRYLAIAKPLSTKVSKTRCKVFTKICAVWIISITISCPVLFLGLKYPYKVLPTAHVCLLNDRNFKIYGSIAAFFIPLSVMITTYTLNIKILSKKAKLCRSYGRQAQGGASTKLLPLPNSSFNSYSYQPTCLKSANEKRQQMKITNEQKAAKLLGVVFGVFVVCWFPFFAFNFLNAICSSCTDAVPDYVANTFLWAGYVSSTINPMVYIVFNKRFRRAYYKVLFCRYCSKSYIEMERMKAINHSITCVSFKKTSSQSLSPNLSQRTVACLNS